MGEKSPEEQRRLWVALNFAGLLGMVTMVVLGLVLAFVFRNQEGMNGILGIVGVILVLDWAMMMVARYKLKALAHAHGAQYGDRSLRPLPKGDKGRS